MQAHTALIETRAYLATRALHLMQYLVWLLMAATVILLVWQHYGMERIIELSVNTNFRTEAHDDHSDHGQSHATIAREHGRLQLHCELVKAMAYPYCGLWFALGSEPKGIDLSDFDDMSFDMRYRGAGQHTIKLYIRNFDRDRSVLNNYNSLRVNELEIQIPDSGIVKAPISLMHTAAWWVANEKIPLENTAIRLDNVTSVELSSGTYNSPGPLVMDVRAVRFHGKWISQNRLLLILVGLWFACGMVWPLLRAIQLRSELGKRETRVAMLSALNHALQLETKELSGQAFSDPLTGALNRQGLRDALLKQWQAPAPLADTTSVIFVDLDHFKRINDSHGHPTGDEVLRRFAAMVHDEIRASDKLVRWGGEEFLIVCPCTTAYQALLLAEKLRLGMASESWPKGLAVTASFGVTELEAGEDIGEGIHRADEALYRAKANGRNRVEVLPELPAALTRPPVQELAGHS